MRAYTKKWILPSTSSKKKSIDKFCRNRSTLNSSNPCNVFLYTRYPVMLLNGYPGYRGTSLIRNNAPLGAYSRTMPMALWWS